MSFKALALSDLHLTDANVACRRDDVFETQLNMLKNIYEIANEEGCEYILQAGDVLDKPRVSNRVLTGFVDLIKSNKQKWVVVPGQHDLKNHNYNNWEVDSDLAIIATLTDKFTVLHAGESKVLSEEFKVRVTGFGFEEPATEEFLYSQPGFMPITTDYREIAIVHASVCDDGSPYWQDIAELSWLKDFAYAQFGDIHKGFSPCFVGETKCFNGGVLTPMKSNEPQCPYVTVLQFDKKGIKDKIVRILDDWTVLQDDNKVKDLSLVEKASDNFLEVINTAKSRMSEDPLVLLADIAKSNSLDAKIVSTATKYVKEAMING